MYIQSDKINVFPLAKNRTTDKDARLLYEHNVANIIKQLIDTDGFVISDSVSVSTGTETKNEYSGYSEYPVNLTNPLEFNIGGYFFRIESGTTIAMVPKVTTDTKDTIIPLYASIQIDNVSKELLGQDTDNKYEGLGIYTEPQVNENNTVVSMHLLDLYWTQIDAGTLKLNCRIPESSRLKFAKKSIPVITRIDGNP